MFQTAEAQQRYQQLRTTLNGVPSVAEIDCALSSINDELQLVYGMHPNLQQINKNEPLRSAVNRKKDVRVEIERVRRSQTPARAASRLKSRQRISGYEPRS